MKDQFKEMEKAAKRKKIREKGKWKGEAWKGDAWKGEPRKEEKGTEKAPSKVAFLQQGSEVQTHDKSQAPKEEWLGVSRYEVRRVQSSF